MAHSPAKRANTYDHPIGSICLSHCYHIFPWLWAWDVCNIIFCHLLHIHYGEFIIIIIEQFKMSANSRVRFGLQIVFVCLYITPSQNHHCANLSDDIELIKCLHIFLYSYCCVGQVTDKCCLGGPHNKEDGRTTKCLTARYGGGGWGVGGCVVFRKNIIANIVCNMRTIKNSLRTSHIAFRRP